MQESKEREQDKDTEENMIALKQKYEEATKELQEYQLRAIISNQPVFNQWIKESIETMYSEIAKIKDGVNQIGQGLSLLMSRQKQDSTEEEDEDFEDRRKKRY